jgi:hypothetical protein
MTSNKSLIHGRFEVTINGQVLISHTSGPFNLECIHAYREHLDLRVQSLAGKCWAMLAVADSAPLHTPESMAEMINTILHQRKLGRCATAIVIGDVEGVNIVKSMLTTMYVQANEPHIFASDEASAMIWLEAQIASAESSGAK